MDNIKKRLFITTGSISLINALTIIEQTKSQGDFEDVLVVISMTQGKSFVDTTKKIASLHSFKEIKFLNKEREIVKNYKLKEFETIFIALTSKICKNIFSHKNVYIFDEGPGSAKAELKQIPKIKGMYTTRFLDKISFIPFGKNKEIYEIDKSVFFNITQKILKLFGESDKLETEKNVLFIGHYVYRKAGTERAIEFYKKYINYFIDKGYNIYFKGHPRDNDVVLPIIKKEFENNKNLHFMENSLPIEIYNYNFDIAVGAYSGTLVSLPHYYDIPAINLPFKELYYSEVGLSFKQYFALYEEYIPSFKLMEQVIGKEKAEIQALYRQIISEKLPLESHQILQKILFYKPNILTNIFWGALSGFCKKDVFLRNKIKNMNKKDFYKMISLIGDKEEIKL